MYILAIETTGPKGSVAIYDLDGDRPIAQKITDEPMGHLRNLMAMTQELLQEEGVSPGQLGFVAASVGPGSYTGIRIGVSSARAICQALDIPAIPVGSLDQFRLIAQANDRPLAAIYNARRGQVYGAVFTAEGGDIVAPGPYMLTDILEAVKDLPDVIFYGDGIDAYGDQLEGYALAAEEERYPTAERVLRQALSLIVKEKAETCGYNELEPLYMRKTEAEQKLADGSLARAREAKMAKFRSK